MSANPLLLAWIKEMYDVAKERNTKGVTTYKNAYDSMKACPLTFTHPSEAQQLHGIGPKICDILTEKLKEHCEANGLPMPKKGKSRKRRTGEELPDGSIGDDPPPAAKKARKPKAYIPALRSGAYALVLALSTIPEDSREGLTKPELQDLAQPHCDSSFTVPSEAGKFYTAWNSMKTLTERDLVYEKGRPRRYYLSDDGWDVAGKIKAVHDGSNAKFTEKLPAKEKAAVQAPVNSNVKDASQDFLDLEEYSKTGTTIPKPVLPRKNSSEGTESINEPSQAPTHPGGQRLGAKPNDSFGTFSSPRERQPQPRSHVVELSSSPEPQTTRHVPRESSIMQQDTVVTSKPGTSIITRKGVPTTQPTLTKQPTNASSKSKSTQKSSLIPNVTPLVLQPGTFTVKLVVDNREVRAKDDRDYIKDELSKKGVKPIMRSLALGDFFWVAKMKDPSHLTRHGEGTDDGSDELALDWIVERKRLDDLVGSITDGRFQEQKFRLKKSGVHNVIYLIEDFTLSPEKESRFHEAIQSAIASTQVVNGYFVKKTQKVDDTIRYLARMTRLLKSIYESNPLRLIPSKILSTENHLPLLNHLRNDPAHRQRSYHLSYPTFKDMSSKNGTLTLRDVFMKMLLCTRGISAEKALAIQKVWPTPRALMDAFGACATEKERDLMIARRLEGVVGRGQVKGALSQKVARIWAEAE